MLYPSECSRALAAAVLWATVLGPAALADTVFSHGGNTYEIITTPKTWTEAAADAAARTMAGTPGALVRVDDQAENDALLGELLSAIPSTDFVNTDTDAYGGYAAYVWLGATDRAAEGVWLWDVDNDGQGDQFWQGRYDGNSVGGLFNAWGSEPDNAGGIQNAAGMCLDLWPNRPGTSMHGKLGTAGQWNDLKEAYQLYYVVEYNSVVPEPGTLSLLCAGGICGLAWLMIGRRRRRASSAT